MSAVENDKGRRDRFPFGENWARFVFDLREQQIVEAAKSLQVMLDEESLHGRSFLDAGSGSGLFSLAARRLGARVHSFDYDPESVACTRELKRRFLPGDSQWTIDEGSVLDGRFLASLGRFDVVYSWGVLHHTGDMWRALENVVPLVDEGGRLFVAIYNDQGRASKAWKGIKAAYNALPKPLRFSILLPAFCYLWGPPMVRDVLIGKPFHSWRSYQRSRGMAPWRDLVDWVGGYPFEVAKPEAIFDFYRTRGFALTKLTTCAGRHGCNQYVFSKPSRPRAAAESTRA